MKEVIYTIPLNEIYDTDCECPLCELKSKLETETVEYALGAAMMEPDFRIESNEKGYCNRHFSMLFAGSNKLSLGLVLDTHLEKMREGLGKFSKEAAALGEEKGGLFKKNNAEAFSQKICSFLKTKEQSCIVCDKISKNMSRYIEILIEMWEDDMEFREKFEKSKGACLPH